MYDAIKERVKGSGLTDDELNTLAGFVIHQADLESEKHGEEDANKELGVIGLAEWDNLFASGFMDFPLAQPRGEEPEQGGELVSAASREDVQDGTRRDVWRGMRGERRDAADAFSRCNRRVTRRTRRAAAPHKRPTQTIIRSIRHEQQMRTALPGLHTRVFVRCASCLAIFAKSARVNFASGRLTRGFVS